VTYKVSTYYDAGAESGFAYDDPEVGIEWPEDIGELLVSPRDREAPSLAEREPSLPYRYDHA
jgi:dTDP-4-dehydrorhamnose 3,5-epimerase